MNKALFLLILLVSVIFVPAVLAQDVGVGMYILNLGKLDVATGSYTADFYLSMKCLSNCSPEGFEFMNGRAASIDKIIDTPNEKFYRISANLNAPIDFNKYPFDRQEIKIIIEDKKNPIDVINYVPLRSESGLDESVFFPGWKIDNFSVSSTEHTYEIYNETYSQFEYTLNISKYYWNSFFKTFLPVMFTLLIVMFSFILDTDKMMARLTIATSSLVAVVMFHISIANQLPPLGYLTFADKFMLLTYFLLLSIVIMNVALIELIEQKKPELAEKVHRRMEYSIFLIIPAIYLVFFLLV